MTVLDRRQAREQAKIQAATRYYLGLDLGQSADYTALAVARRVPPEDWDSRKESLPRPERCRYETVGLKRYELGTPYPAIVQDVREILARPEFTKATLAVDATGVGPPVVDMFRQAGMEPVAITITGGNTGTQDGWYNHHVPKRDLVSVLQVLFQSGRLKIASKLPHAETLKTELLNFKVKITLAANDTYGAWREGQHDDLVLALSLACWSGENIQELEIWGV